MSDADIISAFPAFFPAKIQAFSHKLLFIGIRIRSLTIYISKKWLSS